MTTTKTKTTSVKRKRVRLSPRDSLIRRLEKLQSMCGTFLVPRFSGIGEDFSNAVRAAQEQAHACVLLSRGLADDWAPETVRAAGIKVGDRVTLKEGMLGVRGNGPYVVSEADRRNVAFSTVDGKTIIVGRSKVKRWKGAA